VRGTGRPIRNGCLSKPDRHALKNEDRLVAPQIDFFSDVREISVTSMAIYVAIARHCTQVARCVIPDLDGAFSLQD
jgi:hypothetical protein